MNDQMVALQSVINAHNRAKLDEEPRPVADRTIAEELRWAVAKLASAITEETNLHRSFQYAEHVRRMAEDDVKALLQRVAELEKPKGGA